MSAATLPGPFEQAADRAWVEAVYAEARPLVGLDVEIVSRDVHAVNPIRGRLLRVGKLTDPQPMTVMAFFGTGHLVVDEGYWPQSTKNVAPLNVVSIRALPTAENADKVIRG